MDRNGLLNITRTLSLAIRDVQSQRTSATPEWSWVDTPIVFPESRCVFCRNTIRLNGICFLRGATYERLMGALMLRHRGKINLTYINHPHDTGGGFLCLGRNPTGIALLASPPNLGDCPMGSYRVPQWYKEYWGHDCKEMRTWLTTHGYEKELQELDRL